MHRRCSLAILLFFGLALQASADGGPHKGPPILRKFEQARYLEGAEEAESTHEAEPKEAQELSEEKGGEKAEHVVEGAQGEEEFSGVHEGEEGEEGEAGEEGEEELTGADVEVACMLLGSVSFVMLLMYLVNWHDDDIRRYTWKIISTTISIFLAVLLFQGFNDVLLKWFEGFGDLAICGFQCLHCLLYIVILQFTIAYIAGAICGRGNVDLDLEVWVINDPLSKDNGEAIPEEKVRNKHVKRSAYEDDHGMEIPVQKVKKELNQRMRLMKCYARLLAHMAGFAAINLGSTMQHLRIFRHRPEMAMIPVVITQLLILVVFNIKRNIKRRIRDSYRAPQEAGTEIQTVSHTGMAERCMEMAEEEVFEAENDISALSSSFLIVQVIRFALCGVLPNQEGVENHSADTSGLTIGCLYASGLLFAVASVALAQFMKRAFPNEGEDGHNEQPRVLLILMNATSMAFAWCVQWGTRWLFMWLFLDVPMLSAQSIMGRVVMALLLSGISCLAVFALDFVSDSMDESGHGSQAASQAIQVMVNALGILIGFSWEHCFDGGVAAVASKTYHPRTVKFMMGLLITSVIIPMWRRHILTNEMALQQLKEFRDANKKQLLLK